MDSKVKWFRLNWAGVAIAGAANSPATPQDITLKFIQNIKLVKIISGLNIAAYGGAGVYINPSQVDCNLTFGIASNVDVTAGNPISSIVVNGGVTPTNLSVGSGQLLLPLAGQTFQNIWDLEDFDFFLTANDPYRATINFTSSNPSGPGSSFGVTIYFGYISMGDTIR